jgi:hypothetical protein
VSWTTDVVNAFCAWLAEDGVGTWRQDGAYQASDARPIFVGTMPAAPDRVIVVTPYRVSEDATGSTVVQGFQVRCRGTRDMRDVEDTADDVRMAVHGAHDVPLGPAEFTLVWRQSHTTIGQDANGRWETSSNFYGHTAQASQHTED